MYLTHSILLPGPPKYVKYWPKATKNSPKGHYVTYFGGPGKGFAHSPVLKQQLRQAAREQGCSWAWKGSICTGSREPNTP